MPLSPEPANRRPPFMPPVLDLRSVFVAVAGRWLAGATTTARRVALAGLTFHGLLALYLLLHAGVRAAMWRYVEYDEGEQLLFAQHLSLWYSPQPPLYTWLVLAATRVFGPSALAVLAVKYVILALLYLFLYRVARAVVADPRLAAVAAFAPLLAPVLVWELPRMAHTPLLCVAVLGTLLAVLKLGRGGGTGAFLALGLCAGLGGLAKYNYALFAAALGLSVASSRVYRAAVFRPGLLLSVAVAAAIAGPHLAVAADRAARISERIHARAATTGSDAATGLLGGAANLAIGLAISTAGAVALALLLRRNDPPPGLNERHAERLLVGRFLLLAVAAVAVAAVAAGARRVPIHWLCPGLFLLPVWLLARAGSSPRTFAHATVVFATAALGTLAALAAPLVLDGPTGCSQSRDHAYAEIADRVRADGSPPAIVTTSAIDGGYARLHFPDAAVSCPDYPSLPAVPDGPLLVLVNGATDAEHVLHVVARLGHDRARVVRAEVVRGPACGLRRKVQSVGYAILK